MLHLPATSTVIAILACACFASFIWTILRFFGRGGKTPGGIWLLALTGGASIAGHLSGLLLVPANSRFRLMAAGGLYATALVVFWWSLRTSWQRRLAVAFSSVPSEHILQTGPYRWVRHPIYLAYLLAWLAGGIGIGSWWAWIVLPTMGAQYLRAISHEERQFLTGPLAADYHAYRSRTGMLFPRLLTRRATE